MANFFPIFCALLALATLGSAQNKRWAGGAERKAAFVHIDEPDMVFNETLWEKVSDEELSRHNAELKDRTPERISGKKAGNAAWKIYVRHVDVGHEIDRDLGWLWFAADTNMFTLNQWSNPVVYEVKLLSSNNVWIMYGNDLVIESDVREISHEGGEMKLLRNTNWWRSALPKRITLEQPPFPDGQGDHVRKFTHVNDATTITVSREEATLEQIIRDRWSVTWNFHFWSSDLHKTNYIGWFMFRTLKGEPGVKAQGKPVVYDAMLAGTNALLVVYGDKIKTRM